MPPSTRGKKSSKASKENIGVSCKVTTKVAVKATKAPRKALADKTNSASDDNASCLQQKQKPSVNIVGIGEKILDKQRPRRERRLPSRYIENNGIKNLSNSKNVSVTNADNSKATPVKQNPVVVISPLKTPKLKLDNSLTARRPKRICRLPSKFDDHSISPSKFIPVQPAYASTPKILNSHKETEKGDSRKIVKSKKTTKVKLSQESNKRTVSKKVNNTSKTSSLNSSADTNNNARTKQIPQSKTKNKQDISLKVLLPHHKRKETKKPGDKNLSIRILEDRKTSLKRDASNFDVYEFTYDPSEEPPPQKKKKKKPAKKREPKPRSVVFKDNYDKNLAKALTTLKNTISEKSFKPVSKAANVRLATATCTVHPITDTVVTTVDTHPVPSNPCSANKSQDSVRNYNSVRVEDIALDFELDSCHDDINYSPLHSVCQNSNPAGTIKTPDYFNNSPAPSNEILKPKRSVANDPLNLRENLSFFDDQPVASSSMNVSARNPAASPWRVEFENLPIKWQVNTYVKPNMTPAFESSFIKFNDNKKKHVYTNMVTDTNDETDLPQVYEDYTSKLKQTSIISYIKEVVEKNAKKKKDKTTPTKGNSLFEDIDSTSAKSATLPQNNYVTPKKNAQTSVQSDEQTTSSSVSNISNENEIISDNSKEDGRESSKNSNKKKRNKNVTYFGFDDSENHNQENVSPIKKIDKRKLRAIKPRSRAVLQEINKQAGPTRAVVPVAVKSKLVQSSDMANKLFDQIKSATEPPIFPEENPIQNTEATNITEAQNNIDSNDDQSVHLFEDIEVVHHQKAHRKSYGKAKKAVRFHQNSISDSDVPLSDVVEQSGSSDEDDSLDLTFKVPAMEPKKATRKKKPKKTKISKKEAQEVEAWAAGFNSMCEDIEEFDLVVE